MTADMPIPPSVQDRLWYAAQGLPPPPVPASFHPINHPLIAGVWCTADRLQGVLARLQDHVFTSKPMFGKWDAADPAALARAEKDCPNHPVRRIVIEIGQDLAIVE
jgi:hypothetical protein